MRHERKEMGKAMKARRPTVAVPWDIVEILVAGFKSISEEQRIEIRPLTILAGANSSGKSSMMQPLLLLKQTLEASYDPGTLLLNGPNVKFTSADQLLSRIDKGLSLGSFQVGMRVNTGESFLTNFRKEHKMGFRIDQMEISNKSGKYLLWPEMNHAQIIKTRITAGKSFSEETPEGFGEGRWEIKRARCFLELAWVARRPDGLEFSVAEHTAGLWEGIIPEVIHLPGLRGNPERTYPVTAVGSSYPGTFEKYTASVISEWMDESEATLNELSHELQLMRLAGGISADRVNDVQIELQVGRLPDVSPTRREDRVNIADVGLGVSQTLPVLVGLHAAKPNTLVYVEQPETHLHPRAQFILAQVLASAANRGVRVVVETHSSVLLLGVQTLVAEGHLSPDKVKLHWFQRQPDGRTVVNSADMDEAGAFGDWPEDFDEVSLQTQSRYLDAAGARRLQQQGRS
jgi:predicted ATPase